MIVLSNEKVIVVAHVRFSHASSFSLLYQNFIIVKFEEEVKCNALGWEGPAN